MFFYMLGCSNMSENQEECRVCRQEIEDTNSDDVCKPCDCRGSIAYIHLNCLAGWMKTSGKFNCTLCGKSYMLPSRLLQRYTKEKLPTQLYYFLYILDCYCICPFSAVCALLTLCIAASLACLRQNSNEELIWIGCATIVCVATLITPAHTGFVMLNRASLKRMVRQQMRRCVWRWFILSAKLLYGMCMYTYVITYVQRHCSTITSSGFTVEEVATWCTIVLCYCLRRILQKTYEPEQKRVPILSIPSYDVFVSRLSVHNIIDQFLSEYGSQSGINLAAEDIPVIRRRQLNPEYW